MCIILSFNVSSRVFYTSQCYHDYPRSSSFIAVTCAAQQFKHYRFQRQRSPRLLNAKLTIAYILIVYATFVSGYLLREAVKQRSGVFSSVRPSLCRAYTQSDSQKGSNDVRYAYYR